MVYDQWVRLDDLPHTEYCYKGTAIVNRIPAAAIGTNGAKSIE
jgi:hypothetical protein